MIAEAPTNTYSNWNYSLNKADKKITLKKYTGSETDVIVYGSYQVDGTIYKTKIQGYNEYSADGLFMDNNCVKTITFSDSIDTSSVTGMAYMFSNCPLLTEINFGNNFNTSNVTTMFSMFGDCPLLTSIIGLDKFDTSTALLK